MYLEIKAVISGMSLILMFFVASQVLLWNFLFGFLLLATAGGFIFGDILLGIKIMNTKAHYWFDPLPQGTHELCILKTLSGLVEIMPVEKGVKGIRYGVLHKKKIGILNEGTEQIHTRNGNLGFFAHENYDKNIKLSECKALETLDGDTIKDIYRNLKKQPTKKLVGGIVWNSKTKKKM